MSTTEVIPANANLVAAPQKEAKITTQVLAQIDALRGKQNLQLPPDYSPSNALNAAWLILQDVQDKDKKPVFQNGQLTSIVTKASVANALFDMVIQGLNPAKKQGYFIVYGNLLVWQRSYFGDQVLAQRVRPGIEFYSDVVYEGEAIEIDKVWSKQAGFVQVVAKHTKAFPRTSKNIVGAYCGAVDTLTGENLGVVLMDMDRIQKSWEKSKTARFDNSTHKVYPDEMALRTVIRRRCKPFINASTDANLNLALQRQDLDGSDGEMAEEIAANANREPLALSPIPAPVETAPEPVAAPADTAPPQGSLEGADDF